MIFHINVLYTTGCMSQHFHSIIFMPYNLWHLIYIYLCHVNNFILHSIFFMKYKVSYIHTFLYTYVCFTSMKTFVYSHILYLLILKKKYSLYHIYSSVRKSICIIFIIFIIFNKILCYVYLFVNKKKLLHHRSFCVIHVFFIPKCRIQCLISMNIYILYMYA